MAKANLANLVFYGDAKWFIETYDFPEDLLRAVVRNPVTTEMDPSAEEKGYPVVRYRRGDITVVVGFLDPEQPMVIYVYLHTPDEGWSFGKGAKKAAAGASGSSLPTSYRQLMAWLQANGCRTVPNGRGHYNVYWRDVLLGGIAATGNSDSLKNDFTHIRRRLTAVRAPILAEEAKKALKKEKEHGSADDG